MNLFTIGTLAQEAGVHVETVRFYQRRGLLKEPERPWGGVRRYGATEAARIRFIKAAQQLGFTLEEIKTLLRLEDGTHCREARVIAQQKLVDVRSRIKALSRMESALTQLVRRCAEHRGRTPCPLVETLQIGGLSPEKRGRKTSPRAIASHC